MHHKKRNAKDNVLKGFTYFASAISVLILGLILFFIFDNGLELLNWDIISGDYTSVISTLKSADGVDYSNNSFVAPNDLEDGWYFSERLGIALGDDVSLEGKSEIIVEYIDENSPLLLLVNNNDGSVTAVEEGDILNSAGFIYDDDGNRVAYYPSDGAELVVQTLDTATAISTFPISTPGGGIRGSIFVTIYLVLLTLIIALPIGILTSLYLHELAPVNKLTDGMRSFIDMLTGVPSIVYGLMGAAFFIPLTIKLFGADTISGGNLISGSLTLAVIVLPVIIKATDTALDVVPKEYKEASLALGANVTQTTFKVMLPNSIPGILSAALLSIGRIIGESAALIFAIGAIIKDEVMLTRSGTSLAVHIWTAMSGEVPNIKLSSTIAIIILVVVLSLNMLVKLITYRFMKRFK